MPQSLGSAHSNLGKSSIGLSINPASAPHLQASAEAPEAVQAAKAAQLARTHSDRLQASTGHQVFVREPEDEDEDDQESVLEFPVDKTFNHLVNFIYEQYPDSRPHSDLLVPPRCEFESFFAVADPQAVGCP